MDKGFNDDELADIMSEIESLEEEFTQEVENKVEEPVVAVNEEVAAPETEGVEAMEVHEDTTPVEEVVAEVEEVTTEVAESEEVQPDLSAEVVENIGEPVQEVEETVFHEATEVLEELAELPTAEILPTNENTDNVHELRPMATEDNQGNHHHSSMSFAVSGEMKLDLSFNIAGKTVELKITELGFELELESGMKFSIPLEQAGEVKKAA